MPYLCRFLELSGDGIDIEKTALDLSAGHRTNQATQTNDEMMIRWLVTPLALATFVDAVSEPGMMSLSSNEFVFVSVCQTAMY